MDADATLALLRGRNRYVRQLPSGLWARVKLPRVKEALAAGDIPFPVLQEMAKLVSPNGQEPKPEDVNVSPDTLAHINRYQSGMVLRALKAIGPTEADVQEDAEITPAIVAELEQEDFDQVFTWADRQQPIDPLAETSPSPT
jgi:hypothetical protein